MRFRDCMAGFALALILSTSAPAFAHEDHEAPAAAVSHPAGSSSAMPAMAGMAEGMDHAEVMGDAAPRTIPQRVVRWLGAMHPAAVHFPIALFIVAALLEIAALTLRRPVLTQGTRVIIALAAVSAVAAAALGWFAMGWPGQDDATPYRPQVARNLHRPAGNDLLVGQGTLGPEPRAGARVALHRRPDDHRRRRAGEWPARGNADPRHAASDVLIRQGVPSRGVPVRRSEGDGPKQTGDTYDFSSRARGSGPRHRADDHGPRPGPVTILGRGAGPHGRDGLPGCRRPLDVSQTPDLFWQDSEVFESGGAEGTFARYLEHHLGPESPIWRASRSANPRRTSRSTGTSPS